MNDDELNALYDGFAQTLHKYRLSWVVNQVEEQFNTPPDRRIEGELPLDTYTPQERILLLLRAAEFVVVDTALMEADIGAYFARSQKRRSLGSIGEVTDEPDRDRIFNEDEIEELRDVAKADVVDLRTLTANHEKRQTSAEQLSILIDQIRNEILNGPI